MVCDNYGRLTSIALDPIEKKPLAMYMPGSLILSVGSYGCNLNCSFCQNHEISRAHAGSVPWREVSPRQLCDLALEYRPHGNIGVAFTYNEPLVSMEYLLDTAALLHEADMKVVLVSNGSVSEAAAREVIPHIDAMNIDLKCFTESGYERLGGSLPQTMRFIELAVEDGLASDTGASSSKCCPRQDGLASDAGAASSKCCPRQDGLASDAGAASSKTCPQQGDTEGGPDSDSSARGPHIELTTLVVPGLSDSFDDMKREAAWIASLDPKIPLHVTRYFPRYHMTAPATSVDLVYQLADTAHEYLENVFVGNC